MTFDSKEWLKNLVELMRPTEEELALERVYKRLVAESESNMRKIIELVNNVPPVILFGDECEVETAMAEYEKWLKESDLDYNEEWVEEQIELSKNLKRIELLPERSN